MILTDDELARYARHIVLREFGGSNFGPFKSALADLVIDRLAPIAERFRALRADGAAIDRVLDDGAARARALATPTLDAAYAALGLQR